jgi:hypothetical protein
LVVYISDRWASEHYYRAVRMGDAVLADRADQHADDFAMASASDDEERRILRGLDERRAGLSFFDNSGYFDW